MTTSRKISVMMYTGLVGVALLKGEDEFNTFEVLESAGMIAILDEDE